MRKRGTNVVIFLSFLILLIIPLVSAGVFSDLWGKITGYGTSGTTTVNITIGNAAPTIGFVEVIPDLTPNESWTNTTTFNFTATDTDGGGNINLSTAAAYFQRGSETTRFNMSCVNGGVSGTSVNFTCTIGMWYFDQAGSWTIYVNVSDDEQATGTNSSESFTYISFPAMVMSPTALGWTGVGLASIDAASNSPITVNNTGNSVNQNINITALDLQGNQTTSQHIFAENFTVKNAVGGCGAGTTMVNDTSTNVTSAILQSGNNTLDNNDETSGQEQVFFCLRGVPQDISAQEYSSVPLGAWTVIIS